MKGQNVEDIDEKCLELAKHFLADPAYTDAERYDLATDIQATVEWWLDGRHAK